MSKNKVYESYEKIAQWYNIHRNRDLFEKSYLDSVIGFLNSTDSILDLGCGMGEPIGRYFIEKGFKVLGIDGSSKLIKMARLRFPQTQFEVADMRHIDLSIKFGAIIAWNSFFHLPQDDQKSMFTIFKNHLRLRGILLFTSGPEEGELWNINGGENLYHASLSAQTYQKLLIENNFKLIVHKIEDKECGNSTVWLAQLES